MFRMMSWAIGCELRMKLSLQQVHSSPCSQITGMRGLVSMAAITLGTMEASSPMMAASDVQYLKKVRRSKPCCSGTAWVGGRRSDMGQPPGETALCAGSRARAPAGVAHHRIHDRRWQFGRSYNKNGLLASKKSTNEAEILKLGQALPPANPGLDQELAGESACPTNCYDVHRGQRVHSRLPPAGRRRRVGATESAGLSWRARTRPRETGGADLWRPGLPCRGVDPRTGSNPGQPPRFPLHGTVFGQSPERKDRPQHHRQYPQPRGAAPRRSGGPLRALAGTARRADERDRGLYRIRPSHRRPAHIHASVQLSEAPGKPVRQVQL